MTTDRQLWSLGGLSAAATLIVLLGASGGGGDIARAAAAALGAGSPAPAVAVASTPSGTSDDAAAADDAAPATDDAGAATDAITGASGSAVAASDGAVEATTDSGEGGSATSDATATSTTPNGARVASNIKHVFVITLAGKGPDATFGSGSAASYLNGQLRPKGALLTGFSSLGSAGVPDRIAAVSGQPPNAQTQTDCTTYSQIPPLTKPDAKGVVAADGCTYPSTIVTVAEQLQGQRLTWKDYAEDLDKGRAVRRRRAGARIPIRRMTRSRRARATRTRRATCRSCTSGR